MKGRIRLRSVAAGITILAIAGTLSGCGRYGRPVRPAAATGLPQASVVPAELVSASDLSVSSVVSESSAFTSKRSGDKRGA